MSSTDPHYREAAAAGSLLASFYGKTYRPKVGDRVRGELPFLGRDGDGTVVEVNPAYCLVEIDGERLSYFPQELRYLGTND